MYTREMIPVGLFCLVYLERRVSNLQSARSEKVLVCSDAFLLSAIEDWLNCNEGNLQELHGRVERDAENLGAGIVQLL